MPRMLYSFLSFHHRAPLQECQLGRQGGAHSRLRTLLCCRLCITVLFWHSCAIKRNEETALQ